MTKQMTLTAAALSAGLMAGSAQAAYVVSDGQYFNWNATDATPLAITTQGASDKTHFTSTNGSLPAAITTVDGSTAARLNDTSTSTYAHLTRDYSTVGPSTDFDYVINYSFNIHSMSYSDLTILRERGPGSGNNDTVRLNATKWSATSPNPGYVLYFDFGQPDGYTFTASEPGYNGLHFDRWYDMSMHRTSANDWTVALRDTVTGTVTEHVFSATPTSGGQQFSLNLPTIIQATTSVYDGSKLMDIAVRKLSVGEVPEPASLSLMALGGLLIAGRRR